MQPDVPGALLDLQKIVKRIAELREWQKLARVERARNLYSQVVIPDSDQQEIDTLCGSYMLLDLTIHEALAGLDPNDSPEQKKRWQRRLQELEQTVATLL
jgi:hypothetical protein